MAAVATMPALENAWDEASPKERAAFIKAIGGMRVLLDHAPTEDRSKFLHFILKEYVGATFSGEEPFQDEGGRGSVSKTFNLVRQCNALSNAVLAARLAGSMQGARQPLQRPGHPPNEPGYPIKVLLRPSSEALQESARVRCGRGVAMVPAHHAPTAAGRHLTTSSKRRLIRAIRPDSGVGFKRWRGISSGARRWSQIYDLRHDAERPQGLKSDT